VKTLIIKNNDLEPIWDQYLMTEFHMSQVETWDRFTDSVNSIVLDQVRAKVWRPAYIQVRERVWDVVNENLP